MNLYFSIIVSKHASTATAGEVDPISKSIIMFRRIFRRAPDSMEEIMRYYGSDVDSDKSEKGDRRGEEGDMLPSSGGAFSATVNADAAAAALLEEEYELTSQHLPQSIGSDESDSPLIEEPVEAIRGGNDVDSDEEHTNE